MNVTGSNKGVDAPSWGRSQSFRAGFDVASRRPGQPADHRPVFTSDLLGDAVDSREITLAGEGEARFDDINTQSCQLLRDRQFFLKVETGSRRLFTIPEGGVEDQNAAWVVGHGGSLDAI